MMGPGLRARRAERAPLPGCGYQVCAPRLAAAPRQRTAAGAGRHVVQHDVRPRQQPVCG